MIHWKAEEAAERAESVRRLGYAVETVAPKGTGFLKGLKANLPDAILIDLGRLPMQGRDLAVLIRRGRATRHVPLIFVGGEAEKVRRVQRVLPDAVYADDAGLGQAIKRALARPAPQPVKPSSGMAGYASTPLFKKLKIGEETRVALVNAPPGLFDDVENVGPGPGPGCDLILWFARSREELEARIDGMAAVLRGSSIWIFWPKMSSAIRSDLSQGIVREATRAAGLAEYKVCSLDTTWSGMLFTRARKRRKG